MSAETETLPGHHPSLIEQLYPHPPMPFTPDANTAIFIAYERTLNQRVTNTGDLLSGIGYATGVARDALLYFLRDEKSMEALLKDDFSTAWESPFLINKGVAGLTSEATTILDIAQGMVLFDPLRTEVDGGDILLAISANRAISGAGQLIKGQNISHEELEGKIHDLRASQSAEE